MRRSKLIVSFVVLTTACASLAALLVLPGVSGAGSPSQGSVVEGPGLPEENFPDYSRVVDNSSKRFEAPGWETGSSGLDIHGDDYSFAGAGQDAKPARYKVKIPATDVYSVYAWWPAEGDNDSSTRFGVSTSSGVKWTEVNQRRDGGFWVKLGQYEMEKGNRYAIQVAPGSEGEGYAVADAVAVVRGVTSAPPEDSYEGGDEGSLSTLRISSADDGPNGRDVVRRARSFSGIQYRYATCTVSRMSCTCLTRKSYKKFGVYLPMSEAKQWKFSRGRRIEHRSNLRPGDHVFFKENGRRNGITHVGVYSGNGNIVQASSYFGKVVESKIRYIDGYHGAKRYRLR
jgi:cell wall-associated NlpC family hydrolase